MKCSSRLLCSFQPRLRAPKIRTPRVRAGTTEVNGGLSPAVVRRVIRRHRNEVRYCYESALNQTPDLEGRLVLQFVINEHGRVASAAIMSGSTLADNRVRECVRRAAARWTFPASEGGAEVRVTYPYILSSTAQTARQRDRQVAQNAGLLAAISDNVGVRVQELPEGLDRTDTSRRVGGLNERAARCVGDAQHVWNFDLVVRRNGRVRSVTAQDPPDDQVRTTRCLTRMLRTLRVARRREGGDLTLKVRLARPSTYLLGAFGSTTAADALGSLQGSSEGSNYGFGGLGLSGTGRGGGGTGEGTIGLGNLGRFGNGSRRLAQIRMGRPQVSPGLSPEINRRVLRRHVSELRQCYEPELSNDADLQGRLVLEMVIDPQGRVSSASVADSSTLTNSAVQTCVAHGAARWAFPAPDGGAQVRVTYPIVFSPPTPANANTNMTTMGQVAAGETEVRGSLAREVIQRVIRRNLNQARYCYERALASQPDLAGRVSVRFIISPTGAVQTAQVQSDTMQDRSVGRCLVNALRRWRFPEPQGGGIVIVTYPFVFRPG